MSSSRTSKIPVQPSSRKKWIIGSLIVLVIGGLFGIGIWKSQAEAKLQDVAGSAGSTDASKEPPKPTPPDTSVGVGNPLPTDCQVSEWTVKQDCSCSTRIPNAIESRTVVTQPQVGGKACPELERTGKVCDYSKLCAPVDCQVSDWTMKQDCSCVTRIPNVIEERKIITQPRDGGKVCPELERKTKPCDYSGCVCKTTEWRDDSSCGDCDNRSPGKRQIRDILVNVPGGNNCYTHQIVACKWDHCPVDCTLGPWEDSTKPEDQCSCAFKDSRPQKKMIRKVIVEPKNGGKACESMEKMVNCDFGSSGLNCANASCQLTDWTRCSLSCGGGTQTRMAKPGTVTTNCPTDPKEYSRGCNLSNCLLKFNPTDVWINEPMTATEMQMYTSMAYAPEIQTLVAVGIQYILVKTATDPWKLITLPMKEILKIGHSSPISMIKVVWVPLWKQFVTTTIGGVTISSSDGLSWKIEPNLWSGGNAICWSPELKLLVSTNEDSKMVVQNEQKKWTEVTIPGAISKWTSICWSKSRGLFVAVAGYRYLSGGDLNYKKIAVSKDGYNWTLPDVKVTYNSTPSSVCWAEELGLFVAVCDYGPENIIISEDGYNWEAISVKLSDWTSVCWSSQTGTLVAVSSNGYRMSSRDGRQWTTQRMVGNWRDVVWVPEWKQFLTVTIRGQIGRTNTLTA